MHRPRLSLVRNNEELARARATQVRRKPAPAQDLLPALGGLAARVGHSDFYDVALELIGSLVRCDRRLVMRYSRFDAPSILVNQSLPPDFVASYLDGLYRFDPLYRVVRSGDATGVLTFQSMREDEPVDSFYDEFFASVMIHDELAMMLPAVSGVCIALCFDRSRSAFRDAEVFRLRQLYHLVDALHRLHVERTLFGAQSAHPFDTRLAVLITDADGRALFSNDKWAAACRTRAGDDLAGIAAASPAGEQFLDEDHVLHWETLPNTHTVAPGGRIHIVERTSPGYFNIDTGAIFSAFSDRFKLTPREKEIVWLMLRGNPTSIIAKRLAVSEGTVRNHRYRLYAKLDITTEREIFSLFLNAMLLERGGCKTIGGPERTQ